MERKNEKNEAKGWYYNRNRPNWVFSNLNVIYNFTLYFICISCTVFIDFNVIRK